eukprot:scaffold449_cov241-Pinguiococcus_pyrenoidosus.AAC.24
MKVEAYVPPRSWTLLVINKVILPTPLLSLVLAADIGQRRSDSRHAVHPLIWWQASQTATALRAGPRLSSETSLSLRLHRTTSSPDVSPSPSLELRKTRSPDVVLIPILVLVLVSVSVSIGRPL